MKLHNRVHITIPMRPHLIKFLYWLENQKGSTDPLRISYAGVVADIMKLIAQKKDTYLIKGEAKKPKCATTLKFFLPRYFWSGRDEDIRIFFDGRSQYALGEAVHNLHKELLTHYVLTASEYKITERAAVWNWIEKLGIEEGADDDITFDALTKICQKLRNTRGQKLVRGRGGLRTLTT